MTPSGTRGGVVGIDLGTTNTALARADLGSGASASGPRLVEIVQLVAAGEMAPRPTLPSFLYLPTTAEQDGGALALPWDARPDAVAGIFARDHGALVPTRQVSSAKSWLSNPFVDRRTPLLPFGGDDVAKLSPVEASARILAHLRDAWRYQHPDRATLEEHPIVLTVPASFDEEARELTVEAARGAGFADLTLLEEPLAAVYAWMAAHPGQIDALAPGQLLLVCDVGGGTTDFSLLRADAIEGTIEFERVAIGEHLLLGGDNVDLALAARLARGLAGGAAGPPALSLAQRLALRRQASAGKERLLSDPSAEKVGITVLGGGRQVVGGSLTTELTRAEVLETLHEFLPITSAAERPQRQRPGVLRELGLPYASDPAVTRHLAAFLARAAHTAAEDGDRVEMVRPSAVLFNGGFFAPAAARERILDALAAWFGEPPLVLTNEAPEAAVAIGAAFYGVVRHRPERARPGSLIRAGSARAYYVGVQSAGAEPLAVCVMPRGTQEGTRLALTQEFTLATNQPVAFTLFSSLERNDPLGAVVSLAPREVHRHAPLATVLRYGQRSRRVPLAVTLAVAFTEVGTLELWCESRTTDHRWRLQFNLRAAEATGPARADAPGDRPSDADVGAGDPADSVVIVPEAAIGAAEGLLRAVFADRAAAPDALVGEVENALGHGKHAWPLTVLRRLADVLLQADDGRRASARHEARWLNLTGFCMRPGFGTTVDPWRVAEVRKVYATGLMYPKDIQCQVEWLVLWQRVSAGFTGGQQQELASRLMGMLGLGNRNAPRLNSQLVREAWRLLGSLERLDRSVRVKVGDELVAKVRREPQNPSLAWALGRLAARVPLYGPLNSVVAPAAAERWLDVVLAIRVLSPELVVTIAEIAARTDDPARDIGDRAREEVLARLAAAAAPAEALRRVREAVPLDRLASARLFGEDLPEGLRL